MKNNNGYYTKEIIGKFTDALKAAKKDVKSGADMRVRISNANSKMGNVASVSLLPFLTCPGYCSGTCGKKCYAAKLANLRPTVLKSYAISTAIVQLAPAVYWKQVNAAICGVRFFRFHVSGDIMNYDYFENMVKCAVDNPHCEILAFTKKYDTVNEWIQRNGDLPRNLHILFSGWTNLDPCNPYGIPETNVFSNENEIRENWKICGGNCFNCACRGVGCWQAKNGETIAFKMH